MKVNIRPITLDIQSSLCTFLNCLSHSLGCIGGVDRSRPLSLCSTLKKEGESCDMVTRQFSGEERELALQRRMGPWNWLHLGSWTHQRGLAPLLKSAFPR